MSWRDEGDLSGFEPAWLRRSAIAGGILPSAAHGGADSSSLFVDERPVDRERRPTLSDGPRAPQQTVSAQSPPSTPTLYRYCHYSPTDEWSGAATGGRSRWIRPGGYRRSSPRSRGKSPPAAGSASRGRATARRNNNRRRRRRRRANRIVFTFNSSSASRCTFVIR